jgi:NTE family protein
MRQQLGFVLGGGGARGALQAGALRALVEAEIQPDLMVGTSAGAINAAYLAVHGYTRLAVEQLAATWREAAAADLLPTRDPWLAARLLLRRPSEPPRGRVRDFYIAHGVPPELRFEHLRGPRLFLVATDLHTWRPLVYGRQADDSVLEGLVASTALPPWVLPLDRGGHLVVDGGFASNLPIEPALSLAATEIIALDIDDTRTDRSAAPGLLSLLNDMVVTAQQREKELELALAAARHVPVHQLELRLERPVAVWDFGHTEEALERGYQLARAAIRSQGLTGRRSRWGWLGALWPAAGRR